MTVVAHPGHRDVLAPAHVRLRLARLAFADVPAAEVSLDPNARTVDSLEALGLRDPVFLVGADELAGFLSWKEPERVLELARLGVGTRPGVRLQALEEVLGRVGARDRVELFAIEPVDASSTEVRARAATGESLDGLVPASVAAEIARLGLYRGL